MHTILKEESTYFSFSFFLQDQLLNYINLLGITKENLSP